MISRSLRDIFGMAAYFTLGLFMIMIVDAVMHHENPADISSLASYELTVKCLRCFSLQVAGERST